MKITAEGAYNLTFIKFNGVTHLAFVNDQVVGFQSWKSLSVYSIELTFQSGAAILTEYDDPGKWEGVIALIEERLAR